MVGAIILATSSVATFTMMALFVCITTAVVVCSSSSVSWGLFTGFFFIRTWEKIIKNGGNNDRHEDALQQVKPSQTKPSKEAGGCMHDGDDDEHETTDISGTVIAVFFVVSPCGT